jgi:aminopeptidase
MKLTRRDLLKKGGKVLAAFGVGFGVLSSCTVFRTRQEERAIPLSPSEQRDSAIDNLFKMNLAVKKNERVLVFTDDQNPVVSREAHYVARRGAPFGEIIFFTLPKTGLSAAEPPKELWEKAFGKRILEQIEKKDMMKRLLQKTLKDEEFETVKEIVRKNRTDVVDGVIALAWTSTLHTNFRKLLTDSAEARFASMPAFNPNMWQTAMAANWEQIAQRTIALKNKLSQAVSAKIKTPKGTDLFLDLRDRMFSADTGLLDKMGRSGSLPAGELSIAPVEGRSRGKMVIEPGINPGVKEPMIFEIRDGRVTKMTGGVGYASWLESIFYKYPQARTIAEFGVGTNERAKIGTSVLESEKVLGTIHIAIGDNSTLGGRTVVPFHLVYILENPTVEITFSDGRTLHLFNKEGTLLS